MIYIHHQVPGRDLILGIVRARGIDLESPPPDFDARLRALLGRRQAPLDAAQEAVRQAARDMLRNGRYRPTGRGKPASEYLLRAAQQEGGAGYPRINAAVDICNYVSLTYLVPVSLWDLDRAGASRFLFRLGSPGEAYVFNEGGQQIELADLVVGCRVRSDAPATGEPIVNPVKDSLATKTTDRTTRVAACVYAPSRVLAEDRLERICAEFAALLAACGEAVEAASGVVGPGEDIAV